MITIEINSVDKTDSVIFNTLKIRNKINNQIDECNFQVKKYAGKNYRPNLNDEVVVENDSNIIFGGVITKINETAKAGGQLIYDITCADYSHYLKRQIISERYENETVADIIQDFIDNYTNDGFTKDVSISKTITSISFNGLTVAESLNKLAKALNAIWYVDYDKTIYFFQKTSSTSPFSLTDTSNNYIYDSLRITEDITQLKNRVIVRGGVNPSTSDRTETKVCKDANEDVYPLGYKFANLPIVEVNSSAQTVGIDNIDDDGMFDVMWNYQQKYIRFTSGNLPSVDDVIEITGKIEIPVIVRTPDNASIAQYGVWEFQIKDDTIKTDSEAIERAVTELQTYSDELNEGSFSTYNYGLRAGQILNISSTLRDKNIDVVLQQVEAIPVDPNGEQIRYNITFATLKTLSLIELLQESLIDEDIIEDAEETILNYIQREESMSFVDNGVQDTTITSPPYVYADDAGNEGVWNFSSWV